MPARSPAKAAKLLDNGHGGPRPGAGRPRNPPLPPITEAEIARVAATGETAAEMAHYHLARAVAALVQVAELGTNDAARVRACRELIRWGRMHMPVAKSAAENRWDELLNS